MEDTIILTNWGAAYGRNTRAYGVSLGCTCIEDAWLSMRGVGSSFPSSRSLVSPSLFALYSSLSLIHLLFTRGAIPNMQTREIRRVRKPCDLSTGQLLHCSSPKNVNKVIHRLNISCVTHQQCSSSTPILGAPTLSWTGCQMYERRKWD